MGDFKRTGGCQCGAVRYSFNAPAQVTEHCWCGICRKLHGAIMLTVSIVSRDSFTLEQGADNLATFRSSPAIRRRFCKTCGCHLSIELDNSPDTVEISTGTIDGGEHPGHKPDQLFHVWAGSKVPWHEINDDLPRHERSASEDET